MRKQFGEYYLGLDGGTNSIGWAVTDTNYNVLKFHQKGMWGVHLFEEAKTAADTRGYRSNRRRLDRATWRVKMLQELFAEEISKVDMGFFQRLQESNLHVEDKSVGNKYKYSLFSKGYMTDSEYYSSYPTIFHLKSAQLSGDPKALDIRLLYLSLSHYMKNRGHFLYDSFKFTFDSNGASDADNGFYGAYNEMTQMLQENLQHTHENGDDEDGYEDCCTLSFGNPHTIKKIMMDNTMPISTKSKQLKAIINQGWSKENKPVADALASLLSGASTNLKALFSDDELKEVKISFKSTDIEKFYEDNAEILGERMPVIEKIKAVYDLAILDEFFDGNDSIAAAKVNIYKQHEKDLRLLKEIVRKYAKEEYKKIFGVPQGNDTNYSCYIGGCNENGKKAIIKSKKCSQDEFCNFLKNTLKNYLDIASVKELSDASSEIDRLFYRINNGTAFPKLRTKDNGVIPNQIYSAEVKKILDNAASIHSFLRATDTTGLSIAEKIIQILEFRIPYYVGPLAGTKESYAAKRFWVKRTKEKIYPWNFDQVVDKATTAERFIRNMTNKCTYLPSEDVLPKCSLLYSEFEVRNELNNLSVRGECLSVDIIQRIIDELIINSRRKPTRKTIARFLVNEGILPRGEEDALSGIDDSVKTEMQSYKDMSAIFGAEFVNTNRNAIEDIIKWITLFSGEKNMLADKINDKYGKLVNKEQLKKLKKLNYKDWGRLSKTFLDSERVSYKDESIDATVTIIEAMRREPLNLMQLLSKNCKYKFIEAVESLNNDANKNAKIDYEYINKLQISPAVKRSVWRTVEIVKELKKITGHDPSKIFIEMTRENGEKKRTTSRKDGLLKLYKACKNDIINEWGPQYYDRLNKDLEDRDNRILQSRKLFLYYTQMGRDMYTGEPIDIDRLMDANIYDRDHIYPRSKTKDDSIDNLVLVKYINNREKSDTYPISNEIRTKMSSFWKMLRKHDLISQEKYERLIRGTALTDEELAGFINRQLVETRQSTKAVAEVLGLLCPDSKIVYSKAGNVSDFRKLFELVKCRDINDLHHAKDAYLNIVVGNAFDTKFTDNPYMYISDKKNKYSLRPEVFYKWRIERNSNVAWIPCSDGESGTIATVKRYMGRNNINVTRMSRENKGTIYNATLYKADDNPNLIPSKVYKDVAKYGGYLSAKPAYFIYVESKDKKNHLKRTVEAVPALLSSQFNKDAEVRRNYLKDTLKLIEPRILIDRIKIGSIIDIDFCPMIITGRFGNYITANIATQLVLSARDTEYIKIIIKYINYSSNNSNASIKSFKEINRKQNEYIFDLLTDKLGMKCYKKIPVVTKQYMESKKDTFKELSLENQCAVLKEYVSLFANNAVLSDFTLIKGSKDAGRVRFNKNITSKYESVVLRNFSITGLFEQDPIDLIKL